MCHPDAVSPEDLTNRELIVDDDEQQIIVPADYMTLDEMCAKITPENRHEEIDWGPDVGKEIIEW